MIKVCFWSIFSLFFSSYLFCLQSLCFPLCFLPSALPPGSLIHNICLHPSVGWLHARLGKLQLERQEVRRGQGVDSVRLSGRPPGSGSGMCQIQKLEFKWWLLKSCEDGRERQGGRGGGGGGGIPTEELEIWLTALCLPTQTSFII